VAAVIPAVAAAAVAIPVEVEVVTPGVAAAAAAAAAAIPAAEVEYRRATARHLLRATGHRPAAVGAAVSAGVVLAAGHRPPAMELHLVPLAVTGHPHVRLPPTELPPAEVAVSAAGAVSAAVNPRRLMVHPRVEAAGPRQRTVHPPVAVEVSEAASEVERLRRAMEPLPRVTVHPLRATGHRAAVVEVEAGRPAAMERLALAAAVADILVVVVEVSAEVDTLADQCPPRMVHHREVAAADTQVAAAGIPVAAAAILAAAVVDIPAEAAAVDIPAAAAVDIPAGVEADILAVVVADTPVAAAAAVAGKIKLIPII